MAKQELSEQRTCSKSREQEQSQKPRTNTGESKELALLPGVLTAPGPHHG